jgi:predicted DNA-binding transcriptional regulator AlpA
MSDADLEPITDELANEVDFFIDKKQVAELLGVKPASLYRMEQRGSLPRGFRFDGKVRWSLREMVAFQKRVKAQRQELPPVPINRVSKKMIAARARLPRAATKRLRMAG